MHSPQDKHQSLIENLKDGFAYHQIITDSSGKAVDYLFLEANPAFERITGLSRDEILNRRVTAVLPGIEKSKFDWIGTYGRVALTGKSASFTGYSEALQCLYEVTAYSDEPGFFAVLFRQQEYGPVLFEKAPAMMLMVDSNICVQDLNQATLDFLGKSKAELVGQLCGELFNCTNALEKEGCGRSPSCAHCPIRRSVKHTLKNGTDLKNVEGQFVLLHGTETKITHLLISTCLLTLQQDQKVLLTLVDITAQKMAEEALKQQNRFNKMIADISHRFISLAAESLDHKINYALQRCGEYFEMDRSYIFSIYPDGKTADNTHEWCAPGIEPQRDSLQQIPLAAFPWWLEQLNKKEPAYIYDVDALPPAAELEQRHFESQDIKSLFALPIVQDDRLSGFMGFDAVRDKRSVTGENLMLMQVVAEIVGSAMAKYRTEADLRESEDKFRQMTEHIGEVFWLRSKDNQWIHYVSPAYEEIFGRSRQSLYDNPHSFFAAVHVEDRPKVMEAMSEEAGPLKNTVNIQEFRIVRPDGEVRWIERRSFPVTDQYGRTVRHAGFTVDITERKHKEEQLQHVLEDLKQRQKEMEALHDAFRAVLECETFEEAARRIFDSCCQVTGAVSGYVALLSPDGAENEVLFLEAGGLPCDVNPELPMPIRGLRAEAYKKGAVVYENNFMPSKWARFMPAGHVELRNVMFVPLSIDHKVVGVIGLANKPADFTADHARLATPFGDIAAVALRRMRDKEALKEAKARAEAANQAKSLFLASMSHEIRNPMNVIMGMAGLLCNAELGPREQEYAEMIDESARSLLVIINDILDFSKIESGKLELEHVAFNLPLAIEKAVKPFKLESQKKGLALKLHVETDVPQRVYGDPGRLKQVLYNLLGNALKFTEQGEIAINVEKEPAITTAMTDSKLTRVHFAVRDTGIGIPADKLGLLFESFSQVDSSITRKYGGTGLGLAISKKVIELMGGTISVNSKQGVGSTFAFILPLKRIAKEETTVAQNVSSELPEALSGAAGDHPSLSFAGDGVKPLEILLVEDKPMNRKLATVLLERQGWKVTTAHNGRHALELLSSQHFDLILMDIQMPEMDGLEATKRIRAAEQKSGSYIPIIAMTAHALEGDREQFMKAGMDDYVSKPIDQQELYRAVEQATCLAREEIVKPGRDELTDIARDYAAMLERLSRDKGLISELVQLLLEDGEKDIEKLHNLLDASDSKNAALVAHGLKGELVNLGLESGYKLAQELENALQEGCLERARSRLESLEKYTKELESYINQPDWEDLP